MTNSLIHVAVGVIYAVDGKVLIARRPGSAHQGGLWEFPGGKVDPGETLEQALRRELREELAIEVSRCQPLIQIRHHYADKSVLLDVYEVTHFTGVACGNEGQPIQWVEPSQLSKFDFPAANRPIISAILLPHAYAITGPFIDEVDFLARVSRLLASGVRLLQLRLPALSLDDHQQLLQAVVERARQFDALLQLNTSVELFAQLQARYPDARLGLHLNRHHAAALTQRPLGAEVLLGVSCHNAAEMQQAQAIGADYLLLSPVKPTSSHPDASPLGWEAFGELVAGVNIPVFALGGVTEGDIPRARACGGQGIASISAWW